MRRATGMGVQSQGADSAAEKDSVNIADLEEVGGSGSCYKLAGTQKPVKRVIMNSCLAITKFHMSTRDKLFTQNAVCEKCDFNDLMKAREIIYTFCHPDTNYKYAGPRGGSERDRITKVFNDVYTKLLELDAKDQTPMIVLPSEELGVFLKDDQPQMNQRMGKIENETSSLKDEVRDLKAAFQSYMGNLPSSSTFPGNPVTPKPMPAIPLAHRQRLFSETSLKKRRLDGGKSETISSEIDSDDDNEFSMQRHQKEKLRSDNRRTAKNKQTLESPAGAGKLMSDVLISGPQKFDTNVKSRPKSTWGKCQSPSNGFKGSVPEIFIHNCEHEVIAATVETHLKKKGLDIIKVIQVSNPSNWKKSFKVTTRSYEDYRKLLSGEHVPMGVGVRRFRAPRGNDNSGVRDSSTLVLTREVKSYLNNNPLAPSSNSSVTTARDTAISMASVLEIPIDGALSTKQ